ncbi:MAG: iron-containing alcohol dehydrogenase [Pontiellaceae bacterium]|nr:iron-containing alcohol dehydrogenase [Pontiellaceae bacterium]
MKFEFATAQRIIFGSGKIAELPSLAASLGTRAALITGSNAERIAPIFKMLRQCGANPAAFSITEEPTTTRLITISEQARRLGCDYVVAFGGGSVIDAGKALAALLTNEDDLFDYLEVIGKGSPLAHIPAPCIAVPTTAGTGAEATRNAVLLSPEHRVKVSMRHAAMLPTAAVIDPELMLPMPPEVTASTGLDAFTQLLEAFTSNKANPLTDALCREGLKRVSRSLLSAYTNGTNLEARTDMALGSLFSGIALTNAGLGAAHGFAGPIGGMFKAPHGMVCASLLSAVIKTNIRALEQRDAANPAMNKYIEAAALITANPDASASDLLTRIDQLCHEMQVPGLKTFGIEASDIPKIVEKGKRAGSMKGNPIALTDEELSQILHESLGV